MKLSKLHCHDKVPTGYPGDSTNMLRVDQGWTMTADWAKRVVFVDHERTKAKGFVPFENVKFAEPLPEVLEEKPAKTAKPRDAA